MSCPHRNRTGLSTKTYIPKNAWIDGCNSILELWNQEVNKTEEKENPSSTVSIFGTRHEKKRDHKMGPIYLR